MPSSHNTPLLLCTGCLNLDISARLNAPPAADSRLMTTGFQRSLGGMTANVACAAVAVSAAQAVQVKLLAPCGRDSEGDWLCQQLTQKGIDISWLDRSSSTKTHHCLILVQADGRRMIVSEPTRLDLQQLRSALVRLVDYPGPRLLYLDGFHASRAQEYAHSARQQGWRTAMDMDELEPALQTPKALRQLIQHAFELVFMNQSCASTLAESDAQRDWLALLEPLCATTGSTLLLTLGAQGALLLTPDRPALPIPAPAVQAVDTTGAGDICAGTFLANWGRGLSAVQAARRACVAASLSTTGLGALGYIPDAATIEHALNQLEN